MKKILIMLMACIVSMSLISAVSSSEDLMDRPPMDGDVSPIDGERPSMNEDMQERPSMIKNITLEEGKMPMAYADENTDSNKSDFARGLNMDNESIQNRSKFNSENSSGNNSYMNQERIGFLGNMSENSSKEFFKELKFGACENCTIDFNESSMTYSVAGKSKGKLFGIFDADISVSAEINAETGEVISSKKSWWAFLASESN